MRSIIEKEPLFEVREICKDYPLPHGQVLHVLDKISLTLFPNEVVAIIGPSGCGKSTLLRIIAGLIPSSQGAILYHGENLEGLMPGVSMVFQNFALYPWMTVQGNVEMVLKAAHSSVEEMERKTKEAIALIGLIGFEEAYPREISGGMKQRVGIARALVRNPEMLFMDEPFSSLDAFTAEGLRAEMIRIWSNKEAGLKSILLVSHDVHEVAFMADRIIVLGTNPATIHAVIENKLPRPRDYRSSDFLRLVDQLHDSYGQIKEPTVKHLHKMEKIGPLLPASHDEIVGLLEYLSRHAGTQDVFKIGAESQLHFDKVTIILQAAELLDFVEIVHRDVSLTQKGKEFLKANHLTRRKLWKEQLLMLPIFTKVCDLLKNAPSQSMDRDQLVHFLNEKLPHQNGQSQFSTLARWGMHGDLFVYHRKTRILVLK